MTQSAWAYLAIFVLMALTFIGIPAGPAPARPAGDGDDTLAALTRQG